MVVYRGCLGESFTGTTGLAVDNGTGGCFAPLASVIRGYDIHLIFKCESLTKSGISRLVYA